MFCPFWTSLFVLVLIFGVVVVALSFVCCFVYFDFGVVVVAVCFVCCFVSFSALVLSLWL